MDILTDHLGDGDSFQRDLFTMLPICHLSTIHNSKLILVLQRKYGREVYYKQCSPLENRTTSNFGASCNVDSRAPLQYLMTRPNLDRQGLLTSPSRSEISTNMYFTGCKLPALGLPKKKRVD
jgi:hypothetical protein